MKTVIFWDIDGVFNAFSSSYSKKQTNWLGEWKSTRIRVPDAYGPGRSESFGVNWATELVDEVNKLTALDYIQNIWLTTWQEHSAERFAPAIGLVGEWPVVYIDDELDLYSYKNGWWKLDSIKQQIGKWNEDKIIWIDDDLKHSPEALDWAKENNILTISPESTYGVTKNHIDDIIKFIN